MSIPLGIIRFGTNLSVLIGEFIQCPGKSRGISLREAQRSVAYVKPRKRAVVEEARRLVGGVCVCACAGI